MWGAVCGRGENVGFLFERTRVQNLLLPFSSFQGTSVHLGCMNECLATHSGGYVICAVIVAWLNASQRS